MRVFFRDPRHTRRHRIVVDVELMRTKCGIISHLNVGKSALPYPSLEAKFPFCAIGEIAFDELYRLFNRHVIADRDEQVNMVPHDDKIVNLELTFAYVTAKHVREQIRHGVRLEQGLAFRCPGGNKERARTGFDVLRSTVP